MTRQQALLTLGANPESLTADEKQQLDEKGYVIFPAVMTPEQVADYRAVLARLTAEEGESAGTEQHKEAGTDRVADLVNKDPLFDSCYTHPRVLSAVAHVLGMDIKLFAFSSRSALPGQGEQGLHKDGYQQPDRHGEYLICNTIWLLDEFTPENGATRLIPGSHLQLELPANLPTDPNIPFPGEIRVQAPAGSVVIFNSHVLHGGTRNITDGPRRAMFAAYCRGDQAQLIDERKHLRPETAARISEAAKVLLDVA